MTTLTRDQLCRGLDRLPPIFASCLGMGHEARTATPFEVGGHVYATNGLLVVRVPTPDGWDVPNPERPILVVGHVFRAEYEPNPIALPPYEARDCAYCDGERFRDVTPCPECDGGEVEDSSCDYPNCDGVHPCTDCDGKGNLPAGPCGHCMRSGVRGKRDEGVEIAAGVWASERNLALLVRHGATVYLPANRGPGWGRGDRADPIRFVVGPVEGRMMPFDARRGEYDRREKEDAR